MLNISEEKNFTMSEYNCPECDKYFIAKNQNTEILNCPFCESHAYLNGDFNIEEIIIKEL